MVRKAMTWKIQIEVQVPKKSNWHEDWLEQSLCESYFDWFQGIFHFGEKVFSILVGKKLTVSQKYILQAKAAISDLCCFGQVSPDVWGKLSFLPVEVSLTKNHKDDRELQVFVIWRAKRVRTFYPGEWKAKGEISIFINNWLEEISKTEIDFSVQRPLAGQEGRTTKIMPVNETQISAMTRWNHSVLNWSYLPLHWVLDIFYQYVTKAEASLSLYPEKSNNNFDNKKCFWKVYIFRLLP